jgi:PiT family inorganic phosphate transporter
MTTRMRTLCLRFAARMPRLACIDGMDHITFLVAVVIVTALAFDFTNGFHDTANAMATSIATGALRPRSRRS